MDSSLAAAAVANDTTPNQRKLDTADPEFILDGFVPQKLQCISDASATLFWEVLEF